MGRTKAKKRVHSMPKLGFADQMVYALGYLLILAMLLGIFWFCFFWIGERMLAQPGAVAYEANGSSLLMIPFFISLLLSLFIPWYGLHQKRYPFFGKRGVKYGPPAYPRIFPLFMKDKPQYWKSPSQARMRRSAVITVVALNLVLALLVPFSVYGRDMLYEDGTLVEYSAFNAPKREYDPEEAEAVTLSIRWHSGSRYTAGQWRLGLSIDYGERVYQFYNRSFSDGDWVDELDAVLREFDPDVIRAFDAERLDEFGRKLSADNYAALCAIFERYG